MSNRLMDVLDADRQRVVENVRAAAQRIWERPLHRYFTDHTVAHSERVIALLNGLTAGMMRDDKRLSPVEVVILLAAAYLHDIGMQDERFAGGDLDEIYAHHNVRTAEMIYQDYRSGGQVYGIPQLGDEDVAEAIALVARGHYQVNLSGEEYDGFTSGSGSSAERVRPRLLAALLRFADELDIDHTCVDLEQVKLLDLPLESQLDWWKCYYVSGVNIDENEYVRIEYRFPRGRSDYKELLVPLVERDIRARLAALEEIFRANAVKVALGKSSVRWRQLLDPLPKDVEALARRSMEPDLLVRPEFWSNFAVILSFGKVVHRAFQALDFAYGTRLLDQAASVIRYQSDESLLDAFVGTWRGFLQHYQNFIEQELFEPPAKRDAWFGQVGDAFHYLRTNAARVADSVEIDVEVAARAIDGSSGFYQEIKRLLVEYPEQVKDIVDVVSGPRVGAASQWDRSELRRMLLASFNEGELVDLCAELGQVAYQELPGDGVAAKARALVTYFDRREHIPELVAACSRLRPNLAWSSLLSVPYQTQLATKTQDLTQKTRALALGADSLIQNLVEVIVPGKGD